MLFSDEGTYQNLGFRHIPEEEQAADKKAIDLLKNSPYAQKLDNVGLFLKALQQRAPSLNALLTTHLGNPLATNGTVNRLSGMATQGRALRNATPDRISDPPPAGREQDNRV